MSNRTKTALLLVLPKELKSNSRCSFSLWLPCNPYRHRRSCFKQYQGRHRKVWRKSKHLSFGCFQSGTSKCCAPASCSDHSTIDYFVNNAGRWCLAPTYDPIEEWNKVIAVDLSSVFYCLQAQVKILLPQGGGSIVNVASLAGKKGVVLGSPYAAAKHGVIGLTKTAALEYGQHNIRVNAVCPSFLETDIIQPVPDKVLDFVKNHRVPLKRLGQPEEAAETILWLLSENLLCQWPFLVMDGGMEAG